MVCLFDGRCVLVVVVCEEECRVWMWYGLGVGVGGWVSG